MTPRRITPRTTLDNLRKEAKRWFKALRDGAPDARARFERAHPAAPARPTLRAVQHALAREYGFAGWPALKESVESSSEKSISRPELVSRFLEYACPDHHVRGRPAHRMARHAAMRLLQQHPEIAEESIYTAVVCGELDDVERLLGMRPELAITRRSEAGGDRSGAGGAMDFLEDPGAKNWEPLLFLSFTRMPLAKANDNAVAIARALLDHGADPNAFFMAGDSRYTPLTGVVGEGEEDRPPHPFRDDLARLLMERGANPYDGQVVYNLHSHGNVLWYLKLAYEFSVRAGHKADWDDPEWRMLDMGKYGSGARWHLRIAIQNDDRELAEWCLAHGANPNAAPESGKQFNKRSLYENAVLFGRTEIAELLVRYGADATPVELEGEDAFVVACMRLDRAEARRLAADHPEYLHSPRPIFEAVKRDRADAVELLLDLGVPIELEDEQKQRPLHVAAQNHALRVARRLIARGAEIDPVENNWHNTPLDFAVYNEDPPMIELLSRTSRDVWNLTFTGNVSRLREVLGADSALAKIAGGTTPLFWLPEDEGTAIEIVKLFLAHGVDLRFRNPKDDTTAADVARKRGMHEVAAVLDGGTSAQPPNGIHAAAHYDQLANDLIAVYGSADPVALERLRSHYARALTRDDVRAEVWRRVVAVRQRSSTGVEPHLQPDEAREMVARESGFGNWQSFIEARTNDRPAPGRPWQIDRLKNSLAIRRALAPAEWDAVIAAMEEERLTNLDANGQMNDAVLARVAGLGHVLSLRLGGSRALTDDGLQHLARMPQLEELDLSESPGGVLTDRALEVLRLLPRLRKFHMAWQRGISDAGVANLAFCEQLESVDLTGTFTGDGAIRALTNKPQLRRFKSGRQVTDAGLAWLHQFPMFKSWQGGATNISLMESDPNPNQLQLDGPITNTGVASLAALHGLFALSFFRHTSQLTADALAPLAHLPNLGFLGCGGALCDDAAMRHISAMPRLQMLLAQGAVATDEGFIALSRSQSLEFLWGRDCPNLTGRGFSALSTMSALRGLGVSCKRIDDDALSTLPRFPALRELMPMDVTDDGFRHVGRCEKLRELWCMYCRETTDAATEHIRNLRLESYYAGETRITDRSLEILAQMHSLERLTFWQTQAITNAGLQQLKELPHLRELTLEGLPHASADIVNLFPAAVRVHYLP